MFDVETVTTAEGKPGTVTRVFYTDGKPTGDPAVLAKIRNYLDGATTDIDVSYVFPEGTDFQQAVWHALEAIPSGETRTYGEIAEAISRPGAARAVGSACAANPLPLLIPCHRVLPSSGKLGNYSAGGAKVKEFLLNLEKDRTWK